MIFFACFIGFSCGAPFVAVTDSAEIGAAGDGPIDEQKSNQDGGALTVSQCRDGTACQCSGFTGNKVCSGALGPYCDCSN